MIVEVCEGQTDIETAANIMKVGVGIISDDIEINLVKVMK